MTTTLDRLRGVQSSAAIKVPVRVATTANITLSGEQTIDGVAVVAGDRVLVKDQTDTAENGIYNAATGAWTRAIDFNNDRDITKGTQIYVAEGTAYMGLAFAIDTTSPSIGSAMTFRAIASLGLEVGVNVQAYDAALTSIAALGTAANKGIYFTDVNVAAEFDLTAAGRALLDDANAAAQRTTLELGSAALMADSADTDLTVTPDGALRRDLGKAYVDAAVAAAAWAEYGPVATTGAPSQEITGLRSGLFMLDVLLDKSSLSGTASFLVQLGTLADGWITTGYESHSTRAGSVTGPSTAGFIISGGTAASGFLGNLRLRKKPGTNVWIEDHGGYSPDSTERQVGGGGRITLTSEVDRIRVISSNGTDNIDGGDFSVLGL